MASSSSASEVNIKVAIRLRPTNSRENARNAKSIIQCDQRRKEITLAHGTGKKAVSKTYSFDNVFGQESTQAELFGTMVAPIVDEVMEGYNCTVFAYGQTGTGKTHTMEGHFSDSERRGIIPRSVHLIFEQLEKNKVDFSVKVSYLELYNEELGDLLDDSYCDMADGKKHGSSSSNKKKLTLREGDKGVECKDLTEVNCQSASEVLASLRKGIDHRHVAETQMNKASSRSHSIVTLKIMMKEATANGEQVRFGQLNLVDLAGSECVQRSGATGERLREAGNINQSLLTLGRVITSLSEKRPGFICYRDSKLTRLLQESLGGKAKTCIIATLSPADDSADESTSTLDYAHRARSIKNKPVTNSTSSKNSVLRETAQEIEEMKKMLHAQREKSGTYLPTEKYEEMLLAIESGKVRVAECDAQVEQAQGELLAEKVRANGLASDLAFSEKKCADTEAELQTTRATLLQVETDLAETRTDLNCTRAVVCEQVTTEAALTNEAKTLDQNLIESTKDISELLAKVQRGVSFSDEKTRATCLFGDKTLSSTTALKETCLSLKTACASISSRVQGVLDATRSENEASLKSLSDSVMEANSKITELASKHVQDTNSVLGATEQQLSASTSTLQGSLVNMTEHIEKMECSVSNSLESSLTQFTTQRSILEDMANSVSEKALELESKLNAFLTAHTQSVESMKQAHGTETEKQQALIAQLQATVKKLSTDHMAIAQKFEAESSTRREAASKAHQNNMHQETDLANKRAAACIEDGNMRNVELEKESDLILAQFTASMLAFKEKQRVANLTSAQELATMITTAAQASTTQLTEMHHEELLSTEVAEKDEASQMEDLMNEFEAKSSDTLSELKELEEKTNSDLSASLDKSSGFTQSSISQLSEASSEQMSESIERLKDISKSVNNSSLEAQKLKEDVCGTCSDLLTVTASSQEVASANLTLVTKSLADVTEDGLHYSTLAEKQSELHRDTMEGQTTQFMKELSSSRDAVCALVCGGEGELNEEMTTHLEKHDGVVEDLELSLSSHIESAKQTLESTGSTPEKRKFSRFDTFAQTRPHDIIREECFKSSGGSKRSKGLSHAVSHPESTVSMKRDLCEVSDDTENNESVSARKGKRSSNGGVGSGFEIVKNPLMEHATNLLPTDE